ncbi:MAG: amino acid permease [Planctomycetes bacterium]|nr:amino acid permease [Planctomycetota bacterium]
MPGLEPPTTPGLRRLGLSSAIALVVANMIGTGVFTTSGLVLKDLGRPGWVLLAWLAAGVIAMCGALSYGALARLLPESGGEYYFLRETVHPLAGFLVGWISLLAGFTAPIAVAALGLQAYLAPVLGEKVREEWIGTAAICLAALMHGFRLRHGVWAQNGAVALKLLLISGFIAYGAFRLPGRGIPGPTDAPAFEIDAFAVSMVLIYFSYSGWNAAVYVAGEVRDPQRNLHRSLWMATSLVTILYLALNAVFLYAAPAQQLSGEVEIGAIAAEALGGTALRGAVNLLVALALFTSISAMVMAGPRVYARMAEDGLFPRPFSSRHDVPTPAIALQAGLAILVVWFSELKQLLGYVGFTLGLSAAATVCGLIFLRRRLGPERAPVPGYPWIPGLFVLGTLWAASFMVIRKPFEAGIGLLTVAAGVPFYWIFKWRTRITSSEP